MLLDVAFWTACLVLAWVYVGYPAVLAAVATLRPVRLTQDLPRPSVTVAIAVHNEGADVGERIADALAQDPEASLILEVVVGSDGSTDGTVGAVSEIARTNPRIRLLALDRGGQTATQDALFRAARGDVVLLTDAQTRFMPACVEHLANVFRDARVSCATGRLEWRAQNATATSANEGTYWRYERAVRAIESRAGFLTAVTGALLAVRRSSYRAVPPSASMDHLLPLYARAAGSLVVYVEDAVATDRPISGVREQFRNRSRTATRGIVANLSMVGALAPWRHPSAAIAIWSHKILRWATPFLLIVAALAGFGLAIAGSPLYAIMPLAVGLGIVLAVAGQLVAASGRRPPRPLAFARGFAVVSSAFAIAWLNVARRRRIETWHRSEWHARG